VVAAPDPSGWSTVVATLVDAFDLVLVRPPRRLRPADAARLAARTRERGAVVVQVGGPEALPSDVRFTVTGVEWHGLGVGHGHLSARQVEVAVDGRRQASRPRRARLWLVDPQGQVAPSVPAEPVVSPSSPPTAVTAVA
jgi:hypothetical protein